MRFRLSREAEWRRKSSAVRPILGIRGGEWGNPGAAANFLRFKAQNDCFAVAPGALSA
jgi:hypothetical protein